MSETLTPDECYAEAAKALRQQAATTDHNLALADRWRMLGDSLVVKQRG